MDPLQAQRLRTDIDSAQKTAKEAADIFEASQRTYKRELITIYEKMSLFSAGIVSLSINFFSTLVPENKGLLVEKVFYLSLIDYLYLSWIILTLNILLGLAVRWADSLYTFFSAQRNWHEKRKKVQEISTELNQSYSTIIYSPETTREDQIEISKKNVETLKNILIPGTQKKETFYYNVTSWNKRLATATFVLGIILLLFFVIKITNGMI